MLTEAPERLKDAHGAFYRWTQAGESIAYGSGGELRIGDVTLGCLSLLPRLAVSWRGARV